jgi:hypothetical protein
MRSVADDSQTHASESELPEFPVFILKKSVG